jgi:hypothetical protein
MISSRKCRYLKGEGVGIGGLGGQSGLSHLTIDLFLRHNQKLQQQVERLGYQVQLVPLAVPSTTNLVFDFKSRSIGYSPQKLCLNIKVNIKIQCTKVCRPDLCILNLVLMVWLWHTR